MSDIEVERRETLRDDRVAQLDRMIEIRAFENRVNELFAEGIIHGTTHLCLGQEALSIALALVARNDDVVAATYRGHGIALALGMTPESILAEMLGRASGCTGGLGGSMHLCAPDVGLLPTSAVIGAGLPHAVGAAVAFQNRGEDRVALAVFGDGASNIGAFHESLNMAAVWKLPVVFVCDNNLYGEYSRINITTSVEDISVRAASYGIPGTSVDGMDIPTARDALAEAVERARSGGGPSLVEARTYRFAGHSRADKAEYRPAGELETWQEREPILVATRALEADGVLGAGEGDALDAQVRARIEAVVEQVREAPNPAPSAMFKNIWGIAS
jgi:TPP-dependent pyruvate/acetoin dehydrogenase alpha subunit